jgi:FLVCR family feline leukemia virus subgroup C receptor-related protein/FLVCR family MFS transporter 7
LTPIIVKQSTSKVDIPNLLLIQVNTFIFFKKNYLLLTNKKCIMCLIVLFLIWISFERQPPYWRR